MSHFSKLPKTPDIFTGNFDDYYYRIEDEEGEFTIALFDNSTGNLWIYLKYGEAIPYKYVKPSHSN